MAGEDAWLSADGVRQMTTVSVCNMSLGHLLRSGGVIVNATRKGETKMERQQPVIRSSESETLWNLFESDDAVSLPYNGSSGWSGTDTSEERAKENDTYGKTAQTQAFVFKYLIQVGATGATWKEIADASGWHHGTVSGALSVLHKDGKIARLTERRNRCRVYVHPAYVNERDTDSQGRKPKECPNCGHSL